TLASNSASEPTNCYNAIIKYLAHLWRRGKRKAWRWYKQYRKKRRKRKKCLANLEQSTQQETNPCTLEQAANLEGPVFEGEKLEQSSFHHNIQDRPRQECEQEELVEPVLPKQTSAKVISLECEEGPTNLKVIICDKSNFKTGNGSSQPTQMSAICIPKAQRSQTPELELDGSRSFKRAISNKNECTEIEKRDEKKSKEMNAECAARVAAVKKIFSEKNEVSHCEKIEPLKIETSNKLALLHTLRDPQSNDFCSNYAISQLQKTKCQPNRAKRIFSAPTLTLRPSPNPQLLSPPGNSSKADENVAIDLTNESSCSCDSDESDFSDESAKKYSWKNSRCYYCLTKFRSFLQILVNHRYFQRFIFLAILVNTMSMGIEYHNQPEELTQAVEISNIIFTAIFAVEMVLKLAAEGFYVYISDGFNVFDGTVVLLSVMELIEDSDSGLSVLRTFRLLRILKLVRFMPALKRQLVIMLRTLDNVAVFFALLVLFIFIFSCLGMHLFGGKFCTKADGNKEPCTCDDILNPETVTCVCDRKNFNNFLWALVTVFQILTQEDWNVVLFNGMERTSHWAALYFVVLMTFGNYVLFNLLVAILVEGFSTQEEERKKGDEQSEESDEVKDEKLIYFYDPRDNLERELRLLTNPPGALSASFSNKLDLASAAITSPPNHSSGVDNFFWYPPIITHTAATPQGSPLAGELGHKFLSSALISSSSQLALNFHSASIVSIDKTPTPEKRDFGIGLPVPSTESGLASPLSKRSLSVVSSIIRSNASASGSSTRRESTSTNWLPFRTTKKEEECKELVTEDDVLDKNEVHDKRVDGSHLIASRNSNHSQCNGKIPSFTCDTSSHQLPECSVNSNKCQRQRMESMGESYSPSTPLTRQNSTSSRKVNVAAHDSRSYQSPPFNIGKRYSIVHEVRVLSPGNSLSGIFYCSSVISRKNSSGANSKPSNSGDETSPVKGSTGIVSTGNQGNIQMNALEFRLPQRKFCTYFKWYDWMTKREQYSLFIFSPSNKIRIRCAEITEHRFFDYVILFFISMNCITLAMERPIIPPWSLERELLNAANYIFTFIFALEMVLKVIAKGLWYSDDAYLKSGWNVMDGILVAFSLFDLILGLIAQKSRRIFGILRVFRLLRSLRPLRVINRTPGLKLVVQTLLSSLRPIGNIVLICCTFFIIFGILGVQLFKGAFYYCEGPDVRNVRNRTDCEKELKNKWVNRKYNFDNLGQALMALFVLSSKDGWVNIMYTGLDAVGVDQQPIENYNEWRLLYFISFLLLVAFFVLNMFVGVVVENFHRCREEQEKEERARRAEKRARKLEKRRRSMHCSENRSSSILMHDSCERFASSFDETSSNFAINHCSLAEKIRSHCVHGFVHGVEDETDRYRRHLDVDINSEMREPPYYYGYSAFRLFVHRVVTGKYFDAVISFVIGLNVITMSLEYYEMPLELVYALKLFNFVFTGVFVFECLMKVYALGVRRYLKDKWNQLDVIIVILSIVGIVLEEMESELIPINPTIIRVMRVARIARVLKLLKMAKGMRALLNTVMQALPQVGNLGLLFFLLFFIFAALGVELFGRLECDEDHPCQGLSEHAHFQNFGMAFLTLFRVATGDNWNGVMKDTLRDQCDPSSDCLRNCCVSPIIAPLYFVVFVLLAQFVLVNVVVAVLMKHLEESHKSMDEDEDYEIDMEIARELAAEKRALEEAIERKKREEELRKRRPPLTKVSSLPANFVFHFSESDEHIGNFNNDENSNKAIVQPTTTPSKNECSDRCGRLETKQSGPVIMVEVVDPCPPECSATVSHFQLASPQETKRKLSDVTIVDEESTALTQCLMPPYPEFCNSEQDEVDSITWTGEADSLTSLSSTSDQTIPCLQESEI
ncbi:voltage-dependent T-type calcium channel subunit alpha-1G-like protein, partial [Dinothrombium tinctorium]